MKTFLQRPAVLPEVADVRCNDCGRHVAKDVTGYFEDHISLTKDWGYHSPYDGQSHTIDLCIDCYKSWTAQFEIPPQVEDTNYVWEEII